MDVQVLGQLVGSLGFPIVVAGYLLVKMEKTISQLTLAVTELTALVRALERDRAAR